MVKVQVFIASYNRPDSVQHAVASVLEQSYKNIEVIVSDNSSDDSVWSALHKIDDKRLRYIRRRPSVGAIDHFNIILSEVSSDYFMIFHDDDIMHTDMIKVLLNEILSNDVVAVGANSYMVGKYFMPKRLMLCSEETNVLITDKNEMARRYLVSHAIVPFPSYLYCKEVAQKLRFDLKKGGKYCDAAFLIELTSLGNVLFVVKPLMNYHLSSNQDSSKNHFLHKLKLINFITNFTDFTSKTELVRSYRIYNLYYELVQNGWKWKRSVKRKFTVLAFLFQISPMNFFLRAIVLHLWNRS